MSEAHIHDVQRVDAESFAQRALSAGAGCGALFDLDDQMLVVPPNGDTDRHPYGPLVGLSCSPHIYAAASVNSVVLHDHSGEVDAVVAVAATRTNQVATVAKTTTGIVVLRPERGPLLDIARRALGIKTPAPDATVADLVDSLWLDRALRHVLDADLGTVHQWPSLAVLHPLSEGDLCTPAQLARRRSYLARMVGWATVRERAVNGGNFDSCPIPEISRWLDDGSFARWCQASLPEQDLIFDDLRVLLDPEVIGLIEKALGGN